MKRDFLHSIRKDYHFGQLLEKNINPSPLKQFAIWLDQAMEKEDNEPTAMTLATVDQFGYPSARMVLLKYYSENGFIFFTNYDSQKGKDIANNHNVALLFFWNSLERQIRIEGQAEKISAGESDEYFFSRPFDSQVAAYTSSQSSVIPNRTYLEERFSANNKLFSSEQIKRPDNWGGYLVIPKCFEFWQGRPDRLHDRIRYSLKEGEWVTERLAP